MLHTFTDASAKRVVQILFALEFVLFAGFAFYVEWRAAAIVLAANAVLFIYWKKRMDAAFGGITGDTAGWLSSMSEAVSAGVMAAWTLMF